MNPLFRSLPLQLGVIFLILNGVFPGSAISAEKKFDSIMKSGLELNAVEQELELTVMRMALEALQSEILGEFGEVYDKLMLRIVLKSVPVSDEGEAPTKAWWDSIFSKIEGANADDVSAGMSAEDIERVVAEKVAAAKAKTLQDLESVLRRSVDEEWGKAVRFGIAANCDLDSSPAYDWSDPTVAAFGGDSERSDSKSAKATGVANWDVEGEVTSSAEFQWTLGTASFQRQSEGVKKVVVQAKVDSVVAIHLIADFGIGEHRLKLRVSKSSNTEASNNPDRIEWEFSEE